MGVQDKSGCVKESKEALWWVLTRASGNLIFKVLGFFYLQYIDPMKICRRGQSTHARLFKTMFLNMFFLF